MNRFSSSFRRLLPTRVSLGYWTLTFITFLITAKLGQLLYASVGTVPAFIWLPAGVALAAVFLWGDGMLSAVALAAFVASGSSGFPVWLIVSTTIGNTLQAFTGAHVLRLFDVRPTIDRLRDTLVLIGTALISTTIAPTVGAIFRLVFGSLGNVANAWVIVWSGGIVSIFIITPLVTGYLQDHRITPRRQWERAIALLLTAFITFFIFWQNPGDVFGIPPLYILLIPLFWIALRFSPRSTALALFLISVIAVSGAVLHAPENQILGEQLFRTQLLLGGFAVIFLIVSAAIEERRSVNAELRAHVDELEDAVTQISEQDSAKSDFLAILAHELRNPLAPVLSTLELLRARRDSNDEESSLIVGAENRLHMMGRLLDDLLDISRVSEKRLKLQKEYVSLRDIAARSVESAQPMMDKFKHRFDVLLPTHNSHIFADPIRIEQVLVNVLNNAAKYTPEGGAIEFRAETLGSKAVITVRDNGTGIEQKMLERIFEPFLQISHTKYGTSGVGVGLALAKELVELHEGTINALSAGLGRGSTFVIEFPTAEAPTPVAAVSDETRIPALAPGPLNVLIVDDNRAGTEALARLLSFRGHKTALAFSGQEGLDKAMESQPDAILLDIGLPDTSGYEVAKRLRAGGCRSFIIALTGYGQDEDRRKAIEAGCDGHLTKPVGFQDIEKAFAARFSS